MQVGLQVGLREVGGFGEERILEVIGLADSEGRETVGTDGVIAALGKALRREFGEDFAVYDEEVKQGTVTPCFFICCAESGERQFLGSRFFCERRYLIRYYPKSSDEKKSECCGVLKRLFDCLLWIGEGDGLLMGRKMNGKYEKDALSFFVNYDTFLYRREDKTLMGELSQHTSAVVGGSAEGR